MLLTSSSFILGKTYLQFLIAVLFAPDNLPKALNKKEANLADVFKGKSLNKINKNDQFSKNKRIDNGKIELTFLEPFYHNDVNISDNQMMETIHHKIEDWIKSEPSQWFWQHKRFS